MQRDSKVPSIAKRSSLAGVQVNTHTHIATPPYASIIACLNKAEIKELAHPAANAALTYHGIASFLPAHWLLEAVSNTYYTNDPALITLMASKIAAEFDNKHKNNDKYVISAVDQHKELVKWAWGVQAGKIPRLNYSVDQKTKLYYFTTKRGTKF
jgi:hypothetical protein